jgi:sugar phosphate isomerase/epimerase
MELKFFCPLWGFNHLPFEQFCRDVKDAGYYGVEMGLPLDSKTRHEILNILENHGLALIGQHYETLVDDFGSHKEIFRRHLENLVEARPLFINSQTGKDYFSFEQNSALIDIAREIADSSQVNIIHETHRGKFAFAAHITRDYCERIPELRLGLDISHWCAVAESMLDDQSEAVDMALDRTDHIHSRVGFQEGPQITDPRAPEWKDILDKHLGWWDYVMDRWEAEGRAWATITTEFGPAPYMVHLPHTGQPITSQWEVNLFMKDILQLRYQRFAAG